MIRKVIIFIAVIFIGVKITGAVGYGLITLISLIALIESIPPLKWVVKRMSSLIDVILFGLSIYATLTLGYNITASLVVAGLGFTLIYKPYLRSVNNKTRRTKRSDSVDWK